MLLHFSVSFEDAPIKYHGETAYPISAYQNYDKYTESMKAFCDASLKKSLKRWGFSSDDMIKAEYYFYKGSSETVFFSWEKDDLIENK